MYHCPFSKENGFVEGRGFAPEKKPPHYGCDFPAPPGTNVPAVLDGIVVVNTYNNTYGNVVILKHEISKDVVIYTLYAHLENNSSSSLPVGTHVTQNQIIGKVGSTGISTGPHLHFEVILRSKLPGDITQTPDGSLGIPKGAGRIDPKKLVCKLKILKIIDYIWKIELSGIDTGEKCMGDHNNPWAVGCVYGITLGQMTKGFIDAAGNNDWSFDPCAVNCGIWGKTATITSSEILIIDDIIIRTPGGFFSVKGTKFAINVSKENQATNVFVVEGELKYIKSNQKFQIDKITAGQEITIMPAPSLPENTLISNVAVSSSCDNKNQSREFTQWAKALSHTDHIQILTSRVSSIWADKIIIEIPPGGGICYFSSDTTTSTAPPSNEEKREIYSTTCLFQKEVVASNNDAITPFYTNTGIEPRSNETEINFSPPKHINYNDLSLNITRMFLLSSFKNRRAEAGKLFLVLELNVKNESTREIFISYDEEVRLSTTEKNIKDITPPDNYWLPTDFEPGKDAIGMLLFIIPNKKSNMKVEFGRKNSPQKIEIPLEICPV